MEKPIIRLLLIDDDEDDFFLTSSLLAEIPDKKFEITWESSYEKGLAKIRDHRFDVLVFDFSLGSHSGIDLLVKAKALGCEAPVILLTGKGDLKIDLEAMKSGAADYLIKSELNAEKLDRSIRYALERSITSRALKISEEKYRNIFEKSRDMIYITDENGAFLNFNDSAFRIFGYNREELTNLNAAELYYNKEDRLVFIESIHKTGTVSNYEVTLKHKSGEKRYCLISGIIQKSINVDQSMYNYLGIIHDITRRKKAELDLLIAEKFAASGRLVRTLAHEIRNPLTNINLSLEHLESETNNEEHLSYLQIIERNAKRINDLITDLLNSSRPIVVSKRSYPIRAILKEIVEQAKDRITLKGITLKTDFENVACKISLDKEKIIIAFLNIIINAIEAMKQNSGILNIQARTEDHKCIILISDNGSGISKEHLSHLFEPYFTNKSSGMGLGLVTTHAILQSHHALIDVDSEPGTGTRFSIQFDIETNKA